MPLSLNVLTFYVPFYYIFKFYFFIQLNFFSSFHQLYSWKLILCLWELLWFVNEFGTWNSMRFLVQLGNSSFFICFLIVLGLFLSYQHHLRTVLIIIIIIALIIIIWAHFRINVRLLCSIDLLILYDWMCHLRNDDWPKTYIKKHQL